MAKVSTAVTSGGGRLGVISAEMGILKIVSRLGEAYKGTMSRKMVVSTAYIEDMCNSLVRDGLLVETPKGGYKLTAQGKNVLNPYTGFGLDRTAISNYPVAKAL